MSEQTDSQDAPELNEESGSPSITFESVTFSDGTTIPLDADDVVVLVGPNNAGKSVALRELLRHAVDNEVHKVVSSAHLRPTGTEESFWRFVNQHEYVRVTPRRSSVRIAFPGDAATVQRDETFWPSGAKRFHRLFCAPNFTVERIGASDPQNSIDVLNEVPSHPIHLMYMDIELESRLSKYFRQAFGVDLAVDRLAGSKVPLRTGCRPNRKDDENQASKSFVKRFRSSTVPLHEQGDGMRSFASVILHLLAPIGASILLIDEPEAFLHPPQARLLGEIIATEKSSGAQLFVATHSPDVLLGLVDAGPENLRLLRMQRVGNVNRVKELNKELVKQIGRDPLMNYSSVLSGVFHERVIICEADADCMFYRSILDVPEVRGSRPADVLFVHASGKDRMATLAKTLVSLGVRVDVVADIDVLRNETGLQKIIDALCGDWSAIRSAANVVRKSIDNAMPRLTTDQIKSGIQTALDEELTGGDSAQQLHRRINKIFSEASPWDVVKHGGKSVIPAGDATLQFQQLDGLCKEVGLWIVPVGEMERFYTSIGGHGPAWVQRVIENVDLATNSDLEDARQFVREVWERKQE